MVLSGLVAYGAGIVQGLAGPGVGMGGPPDGGPAAGAGLGLPIGPMLGAAPGQVAQQHGMNQGPPLPSFSLGAAGLGQGDDGGNWSAPLSVKSGTDDGWTTAELHNYRDVDNRFAAVYGRVLWNGSVFSDYLATHYASEGPFPIEFQSKLTSVDIDNIYAFVGNSITPGLYSALSVTEGDSKSVLSVVQNEIQDSTGVKPPFKGMLYLDRVTALFEITLKFLIIPDRKITKDNLVGFRRIMDGYDLYISAFKAKTLDPVDCQDVTKEFTYSDLMQLIHKYNLYQTMFTASFVRSITRIVGI